MLAVEAADEAQVRRRMLADPWHGAGLLPVGAVEPWTIWLDGRQRPAGMARSPG